MSLENDLNELARNAANAEIERLRTGEAAGRALDKADAAAVAALKANEALHQAVEQAKANERVRLTNGEGSTPKGRFYESTAVSGEVGNPK